MRGRFLIGAAALAVALTLAAPAPGARVFQARSLGEVARLPLRGGDTVQLIRGRTYRGTLTLKASGDASEPITIRSGGGGRGKPATITNPGAHNAVVVYGSHVVLSGLRFSDASYGYSRLFSGGAQDRAGAVLVAAGADDVTVNASEFVNVGEGVKTYGTGTTITNNAFHDLRLAFTGTDAMFGPTSYGAIGVAIKGPFTTLRGNRFLRCRAPSAAYGHDGGAIEFEGIDLSPGQNRGTVIERNVSRESQGFLEVDAPDAVEARVVGNLSDDYQDFIFDLLPAKLDVAHNTILRTRHDAADKRDEVINLGSGAGGVHLRSNLVVVSRGQSVITGGGVRGLRHDHNLAWDVDGGANADPWRGGRAATDVVGDPRLGGPLGVRPRAGSAAIGRGGSWKPLTFDLAGRSVPVRGRKPDIGAMQG